MAKDTDLADVYESAMDDFIEDYKDMRRQVTKETTRPLEGRKLTKPERQAANQKLLVDDLELGGQFEEMSARFQLQPGRIPRRLWDAIRAAAKEEPG